MSYVGDPFQHDVFVSYSHGASKGNHDSDLKAWSQSFARDLRSELLQIELDGISVFLDESERSDENVDRTAKLNNHLQDRAEKSALLTVLMTPQYLRSKWCRQEFDWWCDKNFPCQLGQGERLFVCRVRPSDEGAWPEPVKGVVGYFCYDKDKEPDRARPFAWRGRESDKDNYLDLLVDLAAEMKQRLEPLRSVLEEQRRRQDQAEKLVAAAGQTLFLHGREEATAAWEKAYDSLQYAGFSVLPTCPVPIDDDGGLHPEYEKQLRKSDGLLLLAAEEGPAIDTDILVIGRNYRRKVIAEGAVLPGAVVNLAGPGLRTERRLKNAQNLGLGWIDLADDWPDHVRSWLAETGTQLDRGVAR